MTALTGVNSIINYQKYATIKPKSIAQTAISVGQPPNKPSQMSEGYVKGMRSFDVYDSKMSAESEAMNKQVHQKILNDALLTKAVIIRNSHESKGSRTESAK